MPTDQGRGCLWQVLVYHDLLGMMQHPHYVQVTPKFCKQFGAVGTAIQDALAAYREEVQAGVFPGPAHTPYKLAAQEAEVLASSLRWV